MGLDRGAGNQAFSGFLTGKTPGANEIEFVDLIVDHLTERGVMRAELPYESPFTDIAPQGPDEIFTAVQMEELVAALDRVTNSAVAVWVRYAEY